jgi:hypothetical protein
MQGLELPLRVSFIVILVDLTEHSGIFIEIEYCPPIIAKCARQEVDGFFEVCISRLDGPEW